MSHELKIAVRFRRQGKLFRWRTRRPRQGRPFRVELEIMNIGSTVFPPSPLGSITLGSAHGPALKQDLPFEGAVPEIKPGGRALVTTEKVVTFHSDYCSLEANLVASDRKALQITLVDPMSAGKSRVAHVIYSTCFIESEQAAVLRKFAKATFATALLALVISGVAFASRPAEGDGNTKLAAQILAKLDSIEANTSWIRSLASSNPVRAQSAKRRR